MFERNMCDIDQANQYIFVSGELEASPVPARQYRHGDEEPTVKLRTQVQRVQDCY